MPRIFHLLCSFLLIALAACGSDNAGAPPSAPGTPQEPAIAASVSITPGNASLLVGRTTQLTATAHDASGAALTRIITWTSSSNAVATVSPTGLVTAIASGETHITATSGSASATVTVTVSPVPIASVTLSTPGALVPRASQTLVATVRDSVGGVLTGRRVTWTSANSNIATVNDSGLVTGIAAGATTITAAVEGHRAEVMAVVGDGGLVTDAGATAAAAHGAFLLTVPAQAVNTPVALTVHHIADPPAHSRPRAGNAFRVMPATAFAHSATLALAYGSLPNGVRATQLRVHRWDGTAWQALASTVDTIARRVSARVSATGDYALFDVSTEVGSVVIAPTPTSLATGDTLQLRATVLSAEGDVLNDRTVTWSSSNSSIASVTSTGLVRAMAAGTATITATSEGKSASVQLSVAAPIRYSSVYIGALHSCALTEAGEAWCWGSNELCEAGMAPCGGARPNAAPVHTTTRFASLAAGTYFTCGLTQAGAAWCWGLNGEGNLGHANFGIRPEPTPVSGGVTFTSLSAGARHVCGLDVAGKVWCWGDNSHGQLGISRSIPFSTSPVRSNTDLTFRSVGTGSLHTCALAIDGNTWCWGKNYSGELGNGDSEDSDLPTRVEGFHLFSTLSVGEYHNCGLTADGTAWCWGANFKAQIGDASDEYRRIPVKVASSEKFSQIHAFGWSTCALTSDGQTRCWGENIDGQAGAPGDSTLYSPTPSHGSLTFRALASGGQAYHMCGITTAEEWYCWGWNHLGQVGDGTRGLKFVPTRLPSPQAEGAQAMNSRSASPAKSNRGKNPTPPPRKLPAPRRSR